MESHPCPKCKHELDEGHISMTGQEFIGYVSNRQTGMLRQMTRLQAARACPSCGYVEMYLNPEELKKRLG
jgi:predicted nucleic-acid-binding Zn-ribbon protein